MRIARASDDAAGLAISSSLKAQTRLAGQSVRNLNDGISALSIAEGALDALGTILARIEELSVQAMNGASSNTQRAVMQKEVTELQSEWNRIVSSTTFNGKQLLTGSGSRMVLQGGTGVAGALGVQIGEAVLDNGVENAAGYVSRVSTASSGVQGNGGSYVTAISADGRYVAFHSYASNLVSGDTNATLDAFIKDTVTGVTTRVSTDSSGTQGNSQSTVSAISADGRYVAFTSYASNLVSGDTNGAIDAFIKDTITGLTTRVSTISSGGEAGGASVTAISADGRYVALNSDASTLVSGDTNGAGDSFVKDLTKAGIQTLSGMVVSNKVSAGISLNLIQRYRSELISHRANLGASMNRIESFVSAVGGARLTTSEAVSRITDADIAQESASLTAATIRQQVGTSLLSQADKEPELILQLLRNL
jgi:flagellin-like hook-associated protein FlgL